VQRIKRAGYFVTHYVRSRLGEKRPVLGGVKLTHACNLKCAHCPFWKRESPSLEFDQAVSLLHKLHDMGVRLVILEGGEPFLWKSGDRGVRDLVNATKDLFFSVGITTNGTFPIEVDADIVWVSIDGLKKTHNTIRGNVFDRVMENIENSSHPNIYAHVTINRLNWREISNLVDFLSGRVQGITIQFHYPYEGVDGDDLLLPDYRRRDVLDQLILLKEEGYPISDSYACLEALKNNSWKCHPWMIASVEPDGTLTHGCYLKGRADISCDRCGFAAHTEISLAYSGVLESIWLGNKIFNKPRRTRPNA